MYSSAVLCAQVMYYERTGFARMRLEWSSDQGLVREVIGQDSWFHSRSRLGLFPQTVLVYDKPGPPGRARIVAVVVLTVYTPPACCQCPDS